MDGLDVILILIGVLMFLAILIWSFLSNFWDAWDELSGRKYRRQLKYISKTGSESISTDAIISNVKSLVGDSVLRSEFDRINDIATATSSNSTVESSDNSTQEMEDTESTGFISEVRKVEKFEDSTSFVGTVDEDFDQATGYIEDVQNMVKRVKYIKVIGNFKEVNNYE